jgi:hypothetical protein
MRDDIPSTDQASGEAQLVWIPLREELDRLRRRVTFDWAFADIGWEQIDFYYCHDLGDGSSPVRHRFEGMAVENPFRANLLGVGQTTLNWTACTIRLGTEKPRRILVCQADSEDWFHRRVNDIRGARGSTVQSITNSSTLTIGSVLNSTIAPNTSQSGNTNTTQSMPPASPGPDAPARPDAPAGPQTADVTVTVRGAVEPAYQPESSAAPEPQEMRPESELEPPDAASGITVAAAPSAPTPADEEGNDDTLEQPAPDPEAANPTPTQRATKNLDLPPQWDDWLSAVSDLATDMEKKKLQAYKKAFTTEFETRFNCSGPQAELLVSELPEKLILKRGGGEERRRRAEAGADYLHRWSGSQAPLRKQNASKTAVNGE